MSLLRRTIFRSFSKLAALKELPQLQEQENIKRLSAFKEKYDKFVESQKKEIYYAGRELTEAQKERVNMVVDEIFQLSPLESRALQYVWRDKTKRTFNFKPDGPPEDGKETQMRSQNFWPANHPVNVEYQQETGQKGIIGLHGYPKSFMDKFLSGELFSVAAAAKPAEVVEEKKPEKVEKTSFNLVLKGFSPEGKIKLIKELKDMLKLGLKEAKDQLESTAKEPLILAKAISKETHQEIYDKLKGLGADIEFI
ncbi:unnamed protein product [Blepharisma stoltei]|uniref:Large ribosomal subunit protein bL12 C-terminal domain-containing protein n=1 Tax=Blepharisma stoltei TaxID=1481888 RepID=A0AAU9IR13_9CILI|nr:unnamed protein product [Blepharisma stoltei]